MHELGLPHGLGWLQLIAGAAALLLPGFLLAAHVTRPWKALLVAPVVTFSTLTPLALILGTVFAVPVTLTTTLLMIAALSIAASIPHLRRLLTQRPRPIRWTWHWAWAVPAILFVGLVQATPHLPGEQADGYAAWPELAERAWDGITWNHLDAPRHVDSYVYMAKAAYMVRTGDPTIQNPYTTSDDPGDLFSVAGFKQEQGYVAALAQTHLLTGLGIPAILRFLPAMWCMMQGALIATLVYPRPGWMAAPLAMALIPNVPRLLGSGFAASSGFALAWLWVALLIAQRPRSTGRYLLLITVLTGAFFQHLVPAIATYVAVVAYEIASDEEGRPGRVASVLVPLTWILPGIWDELIAEASISGTLPFEEELLVDLALGLLFAGVATVALLLRKDRGLTPLLAVGLAGAISMLVSVLIDHRSDATYTRLIYSTVASLGVLAVLGAWSLASWLAPRIPWARIGVTAVALVLIMTPAVANATDERMYVIFSNEQWRSVDAFAASDAGPGDTFLSGPWKAPAFNAATGAHPFTVLYPGNPPVGESVWIEYLRTGGSQQFFAAHGIDYVIGPVVPSAPHDDLGAGVYRLH